MSRRSLSPAALLSLLLAACGQTGPGDRAGASAPSAPQARQADPLAPSRAARPGNFNALAQAKALPGGASHGPVAPRGTPRAPVHMQEALGVPSFLWAQPGAMASAVAAAPAGVGASASASAPAASVARPATPTAAARAHLAGAAAVYGLAAADADLATLTKIHDTGHGPIIVSFRQRPEGIAVFGEEVSVAMRRDLSLVAISGAISPARRPASAHATGGWSLDARAALAAALTDLTGEPFAAADFVAAGRRGQRLSFDLAPAVAAARAARFERAAGLRQVWFRLPAGLQPAWQVEVALQRLDGGETLAYAMVVSATDGALLFRKDQQNDAAFTYRVWASDVAPFLPDDGPQGLVGTPHPTGLADGYQAPPTTQRLVTLESLPYSRRDPWLGESAGITSGNNVVAYADRNAPDGYDASDLRADVTSPRLFDWSWDPTLGPSATAAQTKAAVTQLFFDVNVLHDWFYDAGFDEAAGNAQYDNYGRGGDDLDPILAEAQDYGGTDNANMTTWPDGTSPRMQLYLWHAGDLVRTLQVDSPPGLAGPFKSQPALFGPQTFNRTGDLVAAVPAEACSSLTNGAALEGKIALIDRGTCTFEAKVRAAMLARAAGVLIRDHQGLPTFPVMAGTDTSINIPSLLVGYADGQAIGAAVAAGEIVRVTMERSPAPMRDGAIDNLLVAHEWGHYLSNRLVQDTTGLDTVQAKAMGEGWSDFVSLLLAVRAEDALEAANAGWAGTYGTFPWIRSSLDDFGTPNQGYYYGIRRTPYSTDLARAPLTFRHVVDGEPLPPAAPPLLGSSLPNSQEHNAGEVWASALWECYAALLRDTQGATPRLTFDEANLRMRRYLVASLKLLPQSPTFLEGRDALLAAAFATDRADHAAFWEAFARRGFGLGAVGPSRYATRNAGVVESFALGGELVVLGVTFGGVTSGCDDGDATLDDGETGTLSITLLNQGTGDLPAAQATITATPLPGGALTFPGGATVAIPPLPLGVPGVVQVAATFSGTGAGALVGLTLSDFPAGYLASGGAVSLGLRVDQDELQAATATETLEGSRFLWTPGADPTLAADALFERWAFSPADHAIHGPDVASPADLTLTSPPLEVGAGPFTVTWRHLHGFETDGAGTYYSGGVVELSDDGGATWHDVGGPAYNGVITPTGYLNPLEGRPAFVDQNPSAPLNGGFDPVSLDLTGACAGGGATPCAWRTVLLRFRIGTDKSVAGPLGWYLDDLAFGGLVNAPFDLLVPDARRCVNRPPTASAGAPQAVDELAFVTLDASGSSDQDVPTTLRYAWLQTAGPLVTLSSTTAVRPTFTAPALDADATLAFMLTVSDGVASSSAATSVLVRNQNRPPVAHAGADGQIDELGMVTLDGTLSADPDPGAALTYRWTQTAGPAVAILGGGSSRPAFQAPEVTGSTTLTFSLVVSDGLLDSAADEVSIEVRNVNRPPVADAGAPQTVMEGATVALDGSASGDPDGTGTVAFSWTQVGSPAVTLVGADQARPTFVAPDVAGDTLLRFQLLVSDGAASAIATAEVLVLDVNRAPVADAGADQSRPERALVTLDGLGSADPDGTPLAYAWTQTGGPAVALLGNGSPVPSFVAPEVGAEGVTLTFDLVVRDGSLPSPADTVAVTITDVNLPPVADAGPDFSAPERSSVLLAAAASDPDGARLTYAWTQAGGPAVTLHGADTSAPTFSAPEVTAATALAFRLEVSDGQLSATSQVVVTITQVNQAPVARVGADQTVPEKSPVRLDAGGSSDPDPGTTLRYGWVQTGGPGVTLDDGASATPGFTAPGGAATLTFRVTVDDGLALSTATTTVTVTAAGESGGCGCSTGRSNPAALVPFLGGLLLLRRRRVRPAAA